MFVDNCAMQIVKNPRSSMSSSLRICSAISCRTRPPLITGSIGMIPSSSSLGDGTRGLYEPIHGSAPDVRAGISSTPPPASSLPP